MTIVSPFVIPNVEQIRSFPPSTIVSPVLIQSWCPHSGPHWTPSTVSCCVFQYDKYGDHLQRYQIQSETLTSHDWVVYKLGTLLGSVGHKVKIHKITPASGKERGDIELNDYIVLPRGQDNCLPPRSLILDFTMTHDRFGRSPYWTVHAHKAM